MGAQVEGWLAAAGLQPERNGSEKKNKPNHAWPTLANAKPHAQNTPTLALTAIALARAVAIASPTNVPEVLEKTPNVRKQQPSMYLQERNTATPAAALPSSWSGSSPRPTPRSLSPATPPALLRPGAPPAPAGRTGGPPPRRQQPPARQFFNSINGQPCIRLATTFVSACT